MNVTITEDYIPKLASTYSCVEFNRDYYTVCIDKEDAPVKLTVNTLTKKLLDEIDGEKNINEITQAFNGSHAYNLSTHDIVTIFNKQLIGYGILEDDSSNKIKVKDKYIYFRITLIPDHIVRKITPLMRFLFDRKTFSVLFILSSLFLIVSFSLTLKWGEFYERTDPWLTAVYIIVIYGSLVLHEFGHAAACDRFGAKSGEIGFGFYILTPVLFANMTDAWRLKRHERVIVDLGGIYVQFLLCSFLQILFFITGSKFILFTSFAIAISFLININPFLRFDGYWALSDFLNIANLKEKSTRAIELFFGKIVGKNKNPLDKSVLNVFLISYGLIRFLALFVFLGYMVFYKNTSILYFPVNLFNFIVGLFTLEEVTFSFIKDSLLSLFLPMIFYIMLIRMVVSYGINKLKPKMNHVAA
jgi:putative peptide zinc metalloprotease protein